MREELASLRGGSCGEYRASPVPTGFIGRRLHLGGVSTCRGLVGSLEMRLDELDERREHLIKVQSISTVGIPLAVRFRSGGTWDTRRHQKGPKELQPKSLWERWSRAQIRAACLEILCSTVRVLCLLSGSVRPLHSKMQYCRPSSQLCHL